MPFTIHRFHGEYRFLSNFWYSPINFEWHRYPTVEHAYQAAKTLILAERIPIQEAGSAGRAKKLGQRVTLRPDWEEVKVEVMRSLLRYKFGWPTMGGSLVATHGCELIEGNTWGDTYWGVDAETGEGENMLGKLLMEVREELIAKIPVKDLHKFGITAPLRKKDDNG